MQGLDSDAEVSQIHGAVKKGQEMQEMSDNYQKIDREIARVKDIAASRDAKSKKSSIAPQSPPTPANIKTIDPYAGGLHIKHSSPEKVTYEKKADKKVKVIFDKDEHSKEAFDTNSVLDRDYHTETDIDGVSQVTL